jgi:hypothetical protein
MGSVSIFCVWEHMMMAADSHEFRLEGGKLRYVHTMTVCGGQQCKLRGYPGIDTLVVGFPRHRGK